MCENDTKKFTDAAGALIISQNKDSERKPCRHKDIEKKRPHDPVAPLLTETTIFVGTKKSEIQILAVFCAIFTKIELETALGVEIEQTFFPGY